MEVLVFQIAFFAIAFVFFAIALGLSYAILWLAARFIHPYFAVGLGVVAVGYLIFGIIDGINTCSGPPTYTPPAPGELGDGSYEFACDAPAGAFIYMGLYFIYPLLALGLALISYRIWRRTIVPRKHSS